MKRAFVFLPYLGLAAIFAALLVRGCRDEGLALEPFPGPPLVELGDLDRPLPESSLAGTVVSASGEAVAEAIVLVSIDGELAWDYTDVQGHFEVPGVPPGEHVVEVASRRYRTRSFAAQSPDDALKLDLGAPADPPPTLPEITRGDLEGEVLASIAERGLLDYEVLLLPVEPPDRYGAPVPVRSAVRADRSFHFQGLIHGEYRIVVLPPWARGGSWPNLGDPGRRTFVHAPSAGELEVTLASGEIQGRLFDRAGDFIEGGLVLVHPEESPERPWPPARSGPDGAFLVRDLPPGTYRIEISAGGARLVQEVPVRAGIISEIDLPPFDV